MRWITIILTFLCISGFGQELDTAYIRTYGSQLLETGNEIIESVSGGYIIVGTTGAVEGSTTDMYVLRIDEELNFMWSSPLGGHNIEWGLSVVEIDNEIFVFGYSNSFGDGGYDGMLYRLNAEGETIWTQSYDTGDWDFGHKILAHPDGGFGLLGVTYGGNLGEEDVWFVRVDDEGEVMWSKYFGGAGKDWAEEMVLNPEGNWTICGYSDSYSTEEFNQTWIFQIDDNGDLIWEVVEGDYAREGYSIDYRSGFYYACGKHDFEEGKSGPILYKVEEGGIVEWIEYENHDGVEAYYDVARNDSRIITVGESNVFGQGGLSALIQRYGSSGSWQNGAAFGLQEDEVANDCMIDSQDRLLVVGYSQSYSEGGDKDVYLIRFNDFDVVPEYDLDEAHYIDISLDVESIVQHDFEAWFDGDMIRVEFENDRFLKLKLSAISGQLISETSVKGNKNFQFAIPGKGFFIVSIINAESEVQSKVIFIP